MMTEKENLLPQGWAKTNLGEIVVLSKEKTDPSQYPDVPYLSLEYIESGTNIIIGCGKARDVKSTKSVFQKGDVLYGRLRPYLNKVCRPNFAGICSTDILVLSETNALDSRFLLRYLSQSSVVQYAQQNSSGINLPRVSFQALSELPVDLPPLPEQRRIAAKIEALQAKSKKAREALEAARPLLDKLRQSVLASAFRGDLTADWRAKNPDVKPASTLLERIREERRRRWEEAELAKMRAKGKEPKNDKWKERYKEPEPVDTTGLPELPKSWAWTTWESTLSLDNGAFKRGPFGSSLKKSIFVSSGYKVYEQYCPINDDCSYVRYYITPEKYEELKAFAVNAKDFLVSCSGTLGRITQVPNNFEEGIINQALLRVRINNDVVNDQFFLRLFRSPYFQKQIFDNATGSAIPNVKGVKDLKAIPIPVPPLPEQLEVNERLKKRLDFIRAIENEVNEVNEVLPYLDQSILAKAFRGDLVAQNPNDEPASSLLERIKAEREALKPKKRKTARRRKKTTA